MSIVHTEGGIDCQIVLSGTLNVNPHEIVTVSEDFRKKSVQTLMGVHGHSAIYLLDRSAVDVQRLGILQRMTVNISGQGIRVPVLNVVAPQLAMETPPPRQIIVDPDKDRKRRPRRHRRAWALSW